MTPTQKALYALGGVVLWTALSPCLQPWLVENVAPTAVAALGRSFGAALKTVALAPVKLFNKQPAWVRGAEIGLGYALYSGGAVLL